MLNNKLKGAVKSSVFDLAENSTSFNNKPYVDIKDVPEKARNKLSEKFRKANLADDGFFALKILPKKTLVVLHL